MKMRTLIATLALALPLTAQAEFDYSYLDGYYARAEEEIFDETLDGFGIRGSAALGQTPFHLTGEFNHVEADVGPLEADSDVWAVGLGYHYSLSPRVDFVGNASYVDVGTENFGDGNGYRLDAGLRGRLTPWVELDGGVRYTDIEDADDTTGYLRGLIGPDNIRLLLEVEGGGDAGELYLIGGRYDF